MPHKEIPAQLQHLYWGGKAMNRKFVRCNEHGASASLGVGRWHARLETHTVLWITSCFQKHTEKTTSQHFSVSVDCLNCLQGGET